MVNNSGFPTVNCGKWEKFRLFIDISYILSFPWKHNTFLAVYCTIKIFCISPVMLRSRRASAHLLVNPTPKFTIVLIWMTPACLKFGKTSNRAVENFPERKLWVWAANHARSHKNLITPNFRTSVCFFGNNRSSHYRIRTSLDPSTTSERVTNLHMLVRSSPCNNSWYARASPRIKKTMSSSCQGFKSLVLTELTRQADINESGRYKVQKAKTVNLTFFFSFFFFFSYGSTSYSF